MSQQTQKMKSNGKKEETAPKGDKVTQRNNQHNAPSPQRRTLKLVTTP
jgi:hypothetical protein